MKPIHVHAINEIIFPKFIKHAKQVTFTRGTDSYKHTWEFVPKPSNTVHILVNKIDTKELLLVKQHRLPALINSEISETLEVCAGIIDKYPEYKSKNRALLVASEELSEELGYSLSIDKIQPLTPMLASVGTIGSTLYPFYCEVTDDNFIGQNLSINEDIEVYKLQYNDVNHFINTTKNTDAITKMLLQYFLLNK